MKTQSSDTNPVVERKLIELLKQQTNSQRLSRAINLTTTTLNLSRRAIARANPGKSRKELDLLFVEYHYGVELSNRLKNFFKKRNDGKE